MEESERLLDDVELFLNSSTNEEGFVDEVLPQNEEIKYGDALENGREDAELFLNTDEGFVDEVCTPEEIKYRDALKKVKRKDYVGATRILTKLLRKEKRTSDSRRNDLWNLGTRLDLRAVCYERRGLIKFAEIDRQRSRNVRDEWRKRDPKRLETMKHVESFSKANDSEAFRVLIKTSAILVLLYALVWMNNTSFRMIFMILLGLVLGLVRMRCFILFHDCTSCVAMKYSTELIYTTPSRKSQVHTVRFSSLNVLTILWETLWECMYTHHFKVGDKVIEYIMKSVRIFITSRTTVKRVHPGQFKSSKMRLS